MILVDTDVMVDIIRRHSPALDWLDSLGTEVIGIPGLVAMELLQGCRNREEQQHLGNFLRPYQRFWPGQYGVIADLQIIEPYLR
jgi:predicted nucleic acid-binding protein